MSLFCLIGLSLLAVLLLVVWLAWVTSPEYRVQRITKQTQAQIQANSKEYQRYVEQATRPYRRRK